MQTQRKKFNIYCDEAKLRQTTHWDLDYMSTAEVNAIMTDSRQRDRKSTLSEDSGGFISLLKRLLRINPRHA